MTVKYSMFILLYLEVISGVHANQRKVSVNISVFNTVIVIGTNQY